MKKTIFLIAVVILFACNTKEPNTKTSQEISDQETFTGTKGDYLIMDTSRIMHRASIPFKSRDMLSITLLPKWKKNNSNEFNKYSKKQIL